MTPSLAILRRVGFVLIAVGFVEAAWAAFSQRSFLMAPLNLVAGILLVYKGSLRVASAVRWLAAAGLPYFTMSVLPLLQPWGLTVVQWRLYPAAMAVSLALSLTILGLFVWLTRALGSPAVMQAREEAGKPRRNLLIPAGLGVASVLVLLVLMRSDKADRAKQLAFDKFGAIYEYHVMALNVTQTSQGRFYRALVTGWNELEVVQIPVEWRDETASSSIPTPATPTAR